MTRLEDALRTMFVSQVESPPPVGDPAAAAIHRGRAVRRRQTAGSTLAVAMACLLTVGGVSSLGGGWWRSGGMTDHGAAVAFDAGPTELAATVTAADPAADTGIGLDLRAGDRLWTTDGRELRLAGVGEVTRVYRVPGGWVYAGAESIRFMRTDGTSVSLSGEDDRWVLNPGGDRIAFVIKEVLYIAALKSSGLAVRSSVEVPAATSPVAFLDDRVIIHNRSLGFDTLDPDKPYTPVWNPDVTAIYGARGDSVAALVRREGEPGPCLADLRVTAHGLTVARTGGCDLALRPDAPADRLAPGGGWLVEPTATGVALVDWDRAISGGRDVDVVLDCLARPSMVPAWVDAKTVVTADARGVVRCRTDGSQQVVALPEGVDAEWQLVPRLSAPSGGAQ